VLEDFGIRPVMIIRMTAIVSKVVKPIVTFSSLFPASLNGEKTPTMQRQVIKKHGHMNVVI
jgi:hypothetical protein